MTDRINLIMLEIERIVTAKLDDGQTVEDLEKDFDKLVLECLPALTASNRQVETLPPPPVPTINPQNREVKQCKNRNYR